MQGTKKEKREKNRLEYTENKFDIVLLCIGYRSRYVNINKYKYTFFVRWTTIEKYTSKKKEDVRMK